MPSANTKKSGTPKSTKKDAGVSAVKAEVAVEPVEKPELTMNTLVPCISMVREGALIYVSKRTNGYKTLWQSFMDMQLVELGELVAMKSSDLSFFSKNWIVIPDSYERKQEVLEYLGVERYYTNTPDTDAINELLDAPVNVIIGKIGMMPQVAKDAVRAVAEKAVADGRLDSLQKIQALENALDCKLV